MLKTELLDSYWITEFKRNIENVFMNVSILIIIMHIMISIILSTKLDVSEYMVPPGPYSTNHHFEYTDKLTQHLCSQCFYLVATQILDKHTV